MSEALLNALDVWYTNVLLMTKMVRTGTKSQCVIIGQEFGRSIRRLCNLHQYLSQTLYKIMMKSESSPVIKNVSLNSNQFYFPVYFSVFQFDSFQEINKFHEAVSFLEDSGRSTRQYITFSKRSECSGTRASHWILYESSRNLPKPYSFKFYINNVLQNYA
jgi:hypothetical protein